MLLLVPAAPRAVTRGTLSELRSWAREGLHGVNWGALIMRVGDRLQLLLQEVSRKLVSVGVGAILRVCFCASIHVVHVFILCIASQSILLTCRSMRGGYLAHSYLYLDMPVLCHTVIVVPCRAVLSCVQEPYTRADVVWDAADHIYDNLIARGHLSPHMHPDATAAEVGDVRVAAAAAVPDAVVPIDQELRLK